MYSLIKYVCCITATHTRLINADNLVTWNIHFDGNKFWSNKVEHIGDCAVLCVRMRKCVSFNFDLQTSVCELNSDYLKDVDNYVRLRPNSVYSNINDWPEEVTFITILKFFIFPFGKLYRPR